MNDAVNQSEMPCAKPGHSTVVRGLAVVALFNLALLICLLTPALPHKDRAIIDNFAQFVGPLGIFVWSLWGIWRTGERPGRRLRDWTPTFLALGVLGYAVGQMIWTYYELILRKETPFPSWADVGYLSAYPFLLLGVLTLPSRKITNTERVRIFFDGILVITTVVTFSWYFVLGPTVMQGGESHLAKAIGTAYPVSDLLLLSFVVLLLLRPGTAALRMVAGTLALGFLAIVAVDSVFDYQTLHGTYETGHVCDIGWTMGYMLVGLAARGARLAAKRRNADEIVEQKVYEPAATVTLVETFKRLPAAWQSLLPYILVPSLGALVWHTATTDGNVQLETGVYYGATLLIALLLTRQFLTVIENQNMALELSRFNQDLERTVAERTNMLSLRTEELGARTETLSALQQLTVAVNETLDIDRVVSSGLQHAQRALRANAAVLWMLPEAEDDEPVQHHVGFENYPEALTQMAGLASDMSSMRSLSLGSDAVLQAPIRCHGKTLGSIGILRLNGEFDPDDLELLESIALQFATALRNALDFQEAREAADHDPVTGLLNHRSVHQHLDDAIEASGSADRPHAIIMADIDNFRLFNNTYGHAVGDGLLLRVASVLSEVCGAENRVARYGGDEFVIVLSLGSSSVDAVALAHRIQERLGKEAYQQSSSERRIPLGLAFGVAEYPHDSQNRHDLLDVAYSNLCEAKNSADRIIGLSEMQRANRALRAEGSFRTLDGMVTAVDNKDRYTRRHSDDVARYSLWIADELELDDDVRYILRVGGLLHDVGKIGVPDEILRKPGRLTEDEYSVLQQHPALGALIVGGIPGMEDIVDCVRSHHERWDGAGYPDKLAGEQIPFIARIMAVADAYSAMTTDRPYRKTMQYEAAIDEVRRCSGTQFDPAIAAAFIRATEKRRSLADTTLSAAGDAEDLPIAA